ncbi:Penicillin-binding protein 4* [compost metagenome]
MPAVMEANKINGAAIAFIEKGKVEWEHGFGYADAEKKITVDLQTLFQDASLSKPVTSWGMMKMVEKGKIELDDPVDLYLTRWHLPESSYDRSGVTLERLLSHSAGISLSGYMGV